MGLGDTLGVLPPENGGTGSTSQNFGELTYTVTGSGAGNMVYAPLVATVPKGIYTVRVSVTFPAAFNASSALWMELLLGQGEKEYEERVINPLGLSFTAGTKYTGMMQRTLCLPSDTEFQAKVWVSQNPKPLLRLAINANQGGMPMPTVRYVLTRLGGIS